MLVVARFRYEEALADQALAELTSCVDQLSQRPGYLSGSVGRALDDPTLWLVSTTWMHVGAYRRALSSYEIKMSVVPLLSHALDEPSAYEVLVGEGADPPNRAVPRGSN